MANAKHAEVGQAVDDDNLAGAGRGDQHAGHRRTYHARSIEGRGIERYRIGQIFLVDQFGDAGLPRRRIEGGNAAQQQREQVDMPELHVAASVSSLRPSASRPCALWVASSTLRRS